MENNRINVLLVEDNPADCRLFERYLDKIPDLRFDLDKSDGAKQAKQSITNDSYDVIFFDHRLPYTTGVKLLANLKKEHAHLPPVVLVTCSVNRQLETEWFQAGGWKFISKDELDPDVLESILNKINCSNSSSTSTQPEPHKAHPDLKDQQFLNDYLRQQTPSDNECNEIITLLVLSIQAQGDLSRASVRDNQNQEDIIEAVNRTLRIHALTNDIVGQFDDELYWLVMHGRQRGDAVHMGSEIISSIQELLRNRGLERRADESMLAAVCGSAEQVGEQTLDKAISCLARTKQLPGCPVFVRDIDTSVE